MSLIKSKSKKAIGKNIKTEIQSGKPKNQALAIVLDTARKASTKIKKKVTKWLIITKNLCYI